MCKCPLLPGFSEVCPRRLAYVPVVSVLTGTCRDCLVVASFDEVPEIQCLVARGQIVSADLP